MKFSFKSILTTLVFTLTLLPAQEGPLVAGEGEKKVITSGYGKNPDEALTQALRNAVEEAVGTYMTSTTRIENDDIIEDKILSLSRGFIKDFKKLSEMKVEGETKVTVAVIVTKTQILETLKASGIKVKVAGKKMFQQFASFDRQMEDEYKLIYDLLKDLPKEGPLDYEVEVLGQPVRSGSDYEIKVSITGTINQNFRNQFSNFRNILNETAFDNKIVEKPFRVFSGENSGLFFNIEDKNDLMNYSVIHSEDEMKNYKNLYGEDIDERSRFGGPTAPTFADLIKDPGLSLALSWHSLDFFNKPYSPYIVGLWPHWSDISNDGYQGKIELYKYLNKKTHQFITMYIEDYFYDIGFRLVIASNKEYIIKIKVKGDGESRRKGNYKSVFTDYKSDFRHMTLVEDTDTSLVGIKEIKSRQGFRQGYGSRATGTQVESDLSDLSGISSTIRDSGDPGSPALAGTSIPIIHEQQFTYGTYGMDLESLKFDKLIRSRFWDEGKTYSAGFPPRLEGSAKYDNKVYKLALLPGPQPYSRSFDAKRTFTGNMKYKMKKDSHLTPLFKTTMTLVLSSNVFENLESIEIEPLPVRKDF